MPKEMKCSECGKRMRHKRYHLTLESGRSNRKASKREWEYKYICKNNHCLNYNKEFDIWELEE